HANPRKQYILLLSYLLHPLLPRPTLFPYTTLFRSMRAGDAPNPFVGHDGIGTVGGCGRSLPALGCDQGRVLGSASGQAPTAATQDRKSTRLNSSHVKISYAVFCLKKKKNKHSMLQH